MLAAKKGVIEAADFVRGFGLNGGYLLTATVLVDGDEDEISAGDVKMGAGLRIFNPDFNAYFKRCVESTVDTGFEDDQVAYVNGLDEVDVIHGRGDDVGARVAIGGNRAREVDEVHETAAEQVTEGVGVVGKNDFSHLGLCAGNGTHKRIRFSRAHF